MMRACDFCPNASFTDGWTAPEMCEAHFDLALILGSLMQARQPFSLENVLAEYDRHPQGTFSFNRDRIPALLAQMRQAEFSPVAPTD